MYDNDVLNYVIYGLPDPLHSKQKRIFKNEDISKLELDIK